jgi:ribosome biogenesis GTPase
VGKKRGSDKARSATVPGIVTRVSSRSVQVWLTDSETSMRCTLRGNLWAAERDSTRPVAAGDRVDVVVDGDAGVIQSVQDRVNRLARPQAFGTFSGRSRHRTGHSPPVQVIAANLDRLIVVAALEEPPFRPGLVDRFCVAADMQGIDAVVVLNKADLPCDRTVAQPYIDAGLTVFQTSVHTREGIDDLAAEMAQGSSLLVGHSGVGKSSLLNAVSPDLKLRVGHVTTFHGRGRHTTTQVTLLRLDNGGWVVDSPGMREFALEDVPPAELARLYPGFEELPRDCHFSNCRHNSEPGCAVRAAVEDGRIQEERYEIYLRILDEVSEGGT